MTAHETPGKLPLPPYMLVPIALAVLGTICQYAGVDEWLMQPFFDATNQTWPYESNWWVAGLIHKAGRDFIAVALSSLLIALIASVFYRPIAKYRIDLAYVLIGSLAGILIVALIKSTTHIYIPSDLIQYGGDMPHIRLFDSVPPGLPIGHAFPAGHSSGAFSLISLFFLFTIRGSKWKYPSLAFCLTLGFIFGIAQQARGKHFFSHDLFSLAICWAAALAITYAMNLPKKLGTPRAN